MGSDIIQNRIEEIRGLVASGLSERNIASRLGVSRMVVRYAKKHNLTKIPPDLARALLIKNQKRCPMCKQIKSTQDFFENLAAADGFGSHCKICSCVLVQARPKEERQNFYRKNKTNIRDRNLRREFGISLEEFNQKLDSQGGVCAICGGINSDRSLAVDHNHTTGQVRGLLCTLCNTAIGHLREDVTIAYRLIEYLNKYSTVGESKNGIHENR
jgi:Recombination endonuclease VII